MFKEVGMRISLLGFKYWISGILISLEKERIEMGKIYSSVAKKYKTTAVGVERAMYYANKDINEAELKKHLKISKSVDNTSLLYSLREVMLERDETIQISDL